jgi:glycerol uptake facilitator protein
MGHLSMSIATSILELGPTNDKGSNFVAEMLGTAILILFGEGVVAAVLLARSKAENAGWIVITAGWAFAVATAVYAVGQYSGAHINPAVTISFAATDRLDWDQVPIYLLGQFAGAAIGATLVYLAYYLHWRETDDPGLKLAVFSTGPAIRNPVMNLVTEIIGTIALLFGILAIVNHFSGTGIVQSAFSNAFPPLLIGILVWVIGLSLGGPTGYAINPARDLGPRIMHAVLPIAGKGTSDWEYAWIPVVGPIIGGLIGAGLYDLFF